MRGLFFFVIFGLGVDSWRERAISEVRGLRDERGPTQLGIYTRISNRRRHAERVTRISLSWIAGSGPAMTEEKKRTRQWQYYFFLMLDSQYRCFFLLFPRRINIWLAVILVLNSTPVLINFLKNENAHFGNTFHTFDYYPLGDGIFFIHISYNPRRRRLARPH